MTNRCGARTETGRAFPSVEALVRHAKGCVSFDMCSDEADRVARYGSAFRPADAGRPGAVNVFTFHADVPPNRRRLDYVDVQLDQGEFDYRGLITHLLWATFASEPQAHLFLVAGTADWAPAPHPNVTAVGLRLDDASPMLERVRAMAAYVHSPAFDRDTVFLDSDAFPNRPLRDVFSGGFDVGLTFRGIDGLMRINEGVIFASSRRVGRVRRFFAAYLASYDRLTRDPGVVGHYGDIRRWRGGQLALNALAWPDGPVRASQDLDVAGCGVRLFPCESHNFWVQRGMAPEPSTWDGKYVLHLKGASKASLAEVSAYQRRKRRPGTSTTGDRRPPSP